MDEFSNLSLLTVYFMEYIVANPNKDSKIKSLNVFQSFSKK